VPPAGPDPGPILTDLEAISTLSFDSYSVATNPVAKPHMSALALATLIQQRTGKPAILHCTTRDHNWLSLQGLLWGARALGIQTVLVATGDYVGLQSGGRTTSVRDVDVYGLVSLARSAGLHAGVVLDPRPESGRLDYEVQRLRHKIQSGAQFAVTQPVFDEAGATTLRHATRHIDIPIMLGILPLRSARHARFLNERVSGIAVPQHIQERMEHAPNPASEGIASTREMLTLARRSFTGAFIMPPFGRYTLLREIL
jgi:homocysteine S-methyltransferase